MTALMVDGTGNGNPTLFTNPQAEGYTGFTPAEMSSVLDGYFANDTRVAVSTPEQFWPFFPPDTLSASVAQGAQDLDAAITSTPGQKVVFGVSQSALIVNEEKQQLLTDPNAPPPSQLSFVVEGNPARPNGGLFTRFPWLSSIPFVGIGPTTASPDSPYDTIDVAAQYDMAADFPKYPLNVVADVNAVMGFFSLHPNYTSLSTQQHPNLSTLTPV
jgi:hypothetical protein